MKRLEIISSKNEYFTRTWQLILKYLHNHVELYMNVMCFDYLMFCDFTENKNLFLSYRIFECFQCSLIFSVLGVQKWFALTPRVNFISHDKTGLSGLSSFYILWMCMNWYIKQKSAKKTYRIRTHIIVLSHISN